MRRCQRKGQSFVESTLVLLIFLSLLLGVMDVAQVLYAHQSLVDRVNRAVRWGVLHPDQGADPVRNMVLYGHPDEPRESVPGYLGLQPENVLVQFELVQFEVPPAERPDDALLTVSIVNFKSQLFSPLIAHVLVNPRPVLVSSPLNP